MDSIYEAQLRNVRTSLRAAQNQLLDNYFLCKEFIHKNETSDALLAEISYAIEYTKQAINRISNAVDRENLTFELEEIK